MTGRTPRDKAGDGPGDRQGDRPAKGRSDATGPESSGRVAEATQRRCTAFDLEILAHLHAEAFPEDPWPPKAFGDLLAVPGTAGLLRAVSDRPVGLALWRVAGDEAEILTLAVCPAARRGGHGRALMDAAMAAAGASGAARMLLEVAEDNLAARRLYAGLGFASVGRRRDYYQRAEGSQDALILESRLTQR